MLIIYISILFLLLTVLLLYLPLWQALVSFALFILLTQGLMYRQAYFYCNNLSIPRYTLADCEAMLQHGDVINNMYFRNADKLNFLKFQSFNYRLSHLAIVIEENGQKYVLESISGKMFDPKRITATSHPVNGGKKWYITKQPLHEYLIVNYTQCIRILRHPNGKSFRVPPGLLTTFQPIKTRLTGELTYCTMFAGRFLAMNGVTKQCTRMFPYRSIPYLEHMQSNGFSESFFFIIN